MNRDPKMILVVTSLKLRLVKIVFPVMVLIMRRIPVLQISIGYLFFASIYLSAFLRSLSNLHVLFFLDLQSDSLGPLDLDMPRSKFQGQDLIFSDSLSLSSLSRLLANSLDEFQNCSLFCLDSKDPA